MFGEAYSLALDDKTEMEMINGGWDWGKSILWGIVGTVAGAAIGAQIGGGVGAAAGGLLGGTAGVLSGSD